MGNGCSSGRYSGDGNHSLPPELPCLKIAIVGDPGVGKTSVLLRYLRNQFSPLYIPTTKVAVENVVRKLNVPANTVVSLTFWDIPGREDMDVHKSYFRNLDAAIVVVDLTKQASINMANVWKQTVLNKLTKTVKAEKRNNNNNEEMIVEVPAKPINFPVLLVGNKFDVIEEEIYTELANRKTSVSMNLSDEGDLQHDAITHLHSMAEKHSFTGSMLVSAKQTDNSVAVAIQALVRNILEKKQIPRKWKPVPPKPKPPKKDIPFVYDKLEKVDMDKAFQQYEYNKLEFLGDKKMDEVIERADVLVKQTVVLRHYFTVSLARLKFTCTEGKITSNDKLSLEDCLMGLKRNIKPGSTLKVAADDYFYKLEVLFDNDAEPVKQSKSWKKAFRCFHNEYASVAKTILKEGSSVNAALEKYDHAMERMLKDFTKEEETTNKNEDDRKQEMVVVANKILRNRAKIQHARREMVEAIQDVEKAGRKISNIDHWSE